MSIVQAYLRGRECNLLFIYCINLIFIISTSYVSNIIYHFDRVMLIFSIYLCYILYLQSTCNINKKKMHVVFWISKNQSKLNRI